MGMSSKKTTTEATNTSTSTPNVPQWGVDSLQGLNAMTQAIAGTDPSKFVAPASDLQNQAFAGAANLGGWRAGNDAATALATRVAAAPASSAGPANLAGIHTAGPAALAGVHTAGPVSLAGPASQAGAVSSADSIGRFLNPYLKNVVDSSMADFDQNAGETRARQAAQGAQADAFGGSRWGIQAAETEGQLSRARGSLDSGLRSNAYIDAETQANNDANRAQGVNLTNAAARNQSAQFDASSQNQGAQFDANAQNQGDQFNAGSLNRNAEFDATARNSGDQFNSSALNRNAEFNAGENDAMLNRNQGVAGLLGSLSNSQNANSIADVTTQGALGDTQRGIDQASRTAPISLAQTVAQLLQGNQLPLLTGSTTNSHGTGSTTQNPSTWDQAKEGVQMAANLAALFSDRRLKRDIVKVGERPDGLGVYLYRYLWSPIRYVGVMAQEVLKVKPEAVVAHPSGFLMVDYGAL